MNKANISREKIIEIASALFQDSETASLNMRTVAARCGVSVGSLYNYFSTKSELEIAVVKHIWNDTFHPESFHFEMVTGFTDLIQKIYTQIASQEKSRYFFLAHRELIAKSSRQKGKDVMEQYFVQIKATMQKALNLDRNVDHTIWTDSFTQEKFVSFVFFHMLSLLSSGAPSCLDLIEVIEKLLYQS